MLEWARSLAVTQKASHRWHITEAPKAQEVKKSKDQHPKVKADPLKQRENIGKS